MRKPGRRLRPRSPFPRRCALHPPPATPPDSVTAGVFPLDQVHRGQHGVAYTVFEGVAPSAIEVEILGILHNALGPGQDLILARLGGKDAIYTGVVAGMSGSPVYIDGKLAGALAFRIGQFSKEPIAGITPIQQMLQVKDMPQGGRAHGQHPPMPRFGRSKHRCSSAASASRPSTHSRTASLPRG